MLQTVLISVSIHLFLSKSYSNFVVILFLLLAMFYCQVNIIIATGIHPTGFT